MKTFLPCIRLLYAIQIWFSLLALHYLPIVCLLGPETSKESP